MKRNLVFFLNFVQELVEKNLQLEYDGSFHVCDFLCPAAMLSFSFRKGGKGGGIDICVSYYVGGGRRGLVK